MLIDQLLSVVTLTHLYLYFSSALSDYEIDYFEVTPIMSAFTFGFVTTKLEKLKGDDMEKSKSGNSSLAVSPEIRIWTVADRTNQLEVNSSR